LLEKENSLKDSYTNIDFYISTKKYSKFDIEHVEANIDYKFNSIYIQFLQKFGTGYFSIDYDLELPNGSSIDSFYTLETVQRITREYQKNDIPKDYIPFGTDGGGSLFCFKRGTDTIYYVDYSFHSIDVISKDFENFLSLILQ